MGAVQVLSRLAPMTQEVAQGRVNVVQVQYVVTPRNLLGTRTLLEQGDDAFQRCSGLADADHSVRVLMQRWRFAFKRK